MEFSCPTKGRFVGKVNYSLKNLQFRGSPKSDFDTELTQELEEHWIYCSSWLVGQILITERFFRGVCWPRYFYSYPSSVGE